MADRMTDLTSQVAARVVVIGVGSDLRGDDGAGLAVARMLRGRAPAAWQVVESNGDFVGLLDLWHDADLAIVVDAAATRAAPGTVLCLDGLREPIPAAGVIRSTHGAGLAEAIALGKALGKLPRQLAVYAIAGENFDFGADLTPAVRHALRAVTDQILKGIST